MPFAPGVREKGLAAQRAKAEARKAAAGGAPAGASSGSSAGTASKRERSLARRLARVWSMRDVSPEERDGLALRAQQVGPYLAGMSAGLITTEEGVRFVDRSLSLMSRHLNLMWLLHPDVADAAALAGVIWNATIRRAFRRGAGNGAPRSAPLPFRAAAASAPPPAPPSSSPAAAQGRAKGTVTDTGRFVPGEGTVEDSIADLYEVLAAHEPDHPTAAAGAARGGS